SPTAWTAWFIWGDGRILYPQGATSSDRSRSRRKRLCADTIGSSTRRLRMQRAVRSVADDNTDLPALPSSVVSLDGQLVDTGAACWRFRSSQRWTAPVATASQLLSLPLVLGIPRRSPPRDARVH